MDPIFYSEVKKRLSRSSTSLIKYFPSSESNSDNFTNNSNTEIYTPLDHDKDNVIFFQLFLIIFIYKNIFLFLIFYKFLFIYFF